MYFLVCLLKCWLLLVDSFTFVNRHCVCVCEFDRDVSFSVVFDASCTCVTLCLYVCESLVVGFEKVCKKFEVKYKY